MMTLKQLMDEESADIWEVLPSNYNDREEDELNACDCLDCEVHDWWMENEDVNQVKIVVSVNVEG